MLASLLGAVESGVANLPGDDWARNGEATQFGLSDEDMPCVIFSSSVRVVGTRQILDIRAREIEQRPRAKVRSYGWK